MSFKEWDEPPGGYTETYDVIENDQSVGNVTIRTSRKGIWKSICVGVYKGQHFNFQTGTMNNCIQTNYAAYLLAHKKIKDLILPESDG